MNIELVEHPFLWISRKTHRTHFAHKGRSTSDTKTNTPGLYDGSAEAWAIVQSALDSLEEFQSDAENCAVGILMHALDYLKGKDITGLHSYTNEIYGLPEEFYTDEPTSGG